MQILSFTGWHDYQYYQRTVVLNQAIVDLMSTAVIPSQQHVIDEGCQRQGYCLLFTDIL